MYNNEITKMNEGLWQIGQLYSIDEEDIGGKRAYFFDNTDQNSSKILKPGKGGKSRSSKKRVTKTRKSTKRRRQQRRRKTFRK